MTNASPRLILLAALLFTIQVQCKLFAQELVLNQGFEEHKPFCADCSWYWPTQSFDYLNNWMEAGHGAMVYCNTKEDKPFEKGQLCCYPYDKPHGGDGMVRFFFIESCPVPPTGCTPYLQAKLSSPLVVGDVYEISMWVYMPENPAIDSGILTNIGMYLSRKQERVHVHDMIDTDYFFSRRIVANQWEELHFYIRALCQMQYLTIGAFRNADFPLLHRRIDNTTYFFVDDVSVKHVEEDSLDAIDPTPYCEYYKKHERLAESRLTQDTAVYFQNNSAELDSEDKETLDRFIDRTMHNPGNVYILTGHTDSRGNENDLLSANRIAAVEQYLSAKYNFSRYRFIRFPQGSLNPSGDNNTEAGRQQNRRVTIQNSRIPSNAAVYREGLAYADSGAYADALRVFRIWLNTVARERKMEILNDPRLVQMRSTPYWQGLVDEVRKVYESYPKSNEAFFLDSMYFADQQFRTYSPASLTGYISGFDTFAIGLPADEEVIRRVDSVHREMIIRYLDRNGYPMISMVGRRQVRSVAIILIHSENPALMERFLPVLEANCIAGEAEWDTYAMMYDRTQVVKGLPQKYGTQKLFVDKTHEQMRYAPMDDLDLVNKRRRKLGMHLIADYNVDR